MVAQASLADVRFYGRTLLNLLGSDGSFENAIPSSWVATVYSTIALDYVNFNSGSSGLKISSATTTNSPYVEKRVSMESGKYYVFITWVKATSIDAWAVWRFNDTNVSGVLNVTKNGNKISAGASGFSYVKISPSDYNIATQAAGAQCHVRVAASGIASSIGLNFTIDSARLFEVSAADYSKIDVDPWFTGDKLAERLLAVNGTKHLQGVGIKKTGKQLIPRFTNLAWSLHGSAVVDSPYALTLNATSAGYKVSSIMIPAVAGQTYTFKMGGNGWRYVDAYDANQTNLGSRVAYAQASASSFTFTTPVGTAFLKVGIDNGNAIGTFTFTDIMLELGSTSSPFEEYNEDYIWLPTILASNLDSSIRDIAYRRENVWYKLKRWVTGVQLDGSLTWAYSDAGTGYKRVKPTVAGSGTLPFSSSSSDIPKRRVIRYDGVPLQDVGGGNNITSADQIGGNNGDNLLSISLGVDITGWADGFIPTSSDMKACANGWKMNNGTSGTPYSGTGTKYWTPFVTPKANFAGKVSGSTTENAHIAKGAANSTLLAPSSGSWAEHSQVDYVKYAALDGDTKAVSTTVSGNMAEVDFSINLIEHVLREHGEAVFGAAVTTADRVTWLKANIGRIAANLYGYGSGPAGNKLTVSYWYGGAWDTGSNHTNGTVTKITRTLQANVPGSIDPNGFFHILAYSDASDGTTASTVYMDYIDLNVELNVQTVPTTGYSSVDYTPPILDYALAQPVEEPIVGAVGSLSLAAGGNVIELFEGVVVEEVTPQLGATSYVINMTTYPNSKTVNRIDKIIAVYRDDKLDTKWNILSDTYAYGRQRCNCLIADYNPAAKYKVVYTVLDKHLYTTNAVEAKVEYKSTAKSIQGDLVQQVADLETQASISINAVAAIYARLKAGGL